MPQHLWPQHIPISHRRYVLSHFYDNWSISTTEQKTQIFIQSPFFSQYPAQYGINMGSYNATYASTTQPGTQATNPFAAAGQIPHVSSSQSALAIGQSARPDQEVTPPPTAARTVPSPGATSVPTATSSMPGTTNPLSFEGNPYALYSSYNFGSYPTNVQAKSEPLA